MSLYSSVFILILVLVILPIFLYIKLLDLGVDYKTALNVMLTIPICIPLAHLKIYNELKEEDKKEARHFLLLPIKNFKLVALIYAKSAISAKAKLKAINELIPTLNKAEINKLIEILKDEGIKIKTQKGKLKDINHKKRKNIDITTRVIERILIKRFSKSGILVSDLFKTEVESNIREELPQMKICKLI